MKRLIRIIFLLVLIQHIITEPLCTEDGAGCYSVDVPPSKFCARFGDYCKLVPHCEWASENEKECKLYPVVVGAHIQGCFPNDNGGCVIRPLCTTINKPTTDEECRKHPVSFNKVIDHICVAKSDKTGCEEKLLCESVSTLNEGEICGNFPGLYIDNVCIYNQWGGTLCIEKEYCSNTRGKLFEHGCITHPISEKDNKDDYLCVPKLGDGCEERLDCEKVTKLEKG